MDQLRAYLHKTGSVMLARAPAILISGGIQYLVLSTIAMALYPGGTKYDPSTAGYLFWNNMISDMGRTIAHNSMPNIPSSVLFTITMIALAISFVPFYIAMSMQFSSAARTRKHATIAAVLGIVTGVLLALSALFPQDLFPQLHLRLAQFSFLSLAPAMIIYWWLVRAHDRFPVPCATTFLVFSIIILAGIGVTIASGSGIDVVTVTTQAATQKIMVYAWNALLPIEAWGLWKINHEKKERALSRA